MGSNKVGELGIGELRSGLRGGEGLNESQCDEGIETAEDIQGGGIVAKQDRPKAIVGGNNLPSEKVDQTDTSADLTGERAVRAPGGKTVKIRAQQIGDQAGVRTIVFGAALTKTTLGALDHIGVQNVDLLVASLSEKIKDQGMSGFNADSTLLGRDAKAMAGSVNFDETGQVAIDLKIEKRVGKIVGEECSMLAGAPVDSKVYLHVDLLEEENGRPAEWIV